MRVSIIGYGNIGKAIRTLLRQEQIFKAVDAYDSQEIPGSIKIQNLEDAVKDYDIVVCCTPYTVNKQVVDLCVEHKTAYFDLTEDTLCTAYIRDLQTDTFLMPQCGLAPGAVNIIAADLSRQFEVTRDIQIRVGALPLYPSNRMGYYLSWSTEGVINEYCNPCDAIVDGENVKVQPLEGYETVYIDGTEYEAFNTSGGSGTMCESYVGKVQSLNYKTLRYPNHWKYMKFLLDDLNLKEHKEVIATIFNKEVPYTSDDVVVINIKVVGEAHNGRYEEKTYNRKIYGIGGHSAIQLTTASGVCAVIFLYAKGILKGSGFMKQEDVGFNDFLYSNYGRIYA